MHTPSSATPRQLSADPINPLAPILRDYGVVILDGALATELEHRGCDLRDPLWSATVLLESPQLIKQLHAEYFAGGADCVITASYQATFQGLAQRGLSEAEAKDLLLLAVQLAVEARDEFWAEPANRNNRPKPLVAASIGPYGAYLADGSEYTGDYGVTEAELAAFHRPRLAVLAGSDADLLACETIPCRQEAEVLAQLLVEFPERSAWVSFTARDGAHTSHGEKIAECAQRLDRFPQIVAMGVNCTAPRYIPNLIAELRRGTTKPLVAYPNSGEGYDPETGCWTGEADVRSYAAEAVTWYQDGARIIGGCCRTTPADIRELARELGFRE